MLDDNFVLFKLYLTTLVITLQIQIIDLYFLLLINKCMIYYDGLSCRAFPITCMLMIKHNNKQQQQQQQQQQTKSLLQIC